MLNKNVDKLGWGIVSAILIVDGITGAITGKIMSKINPGTVATEGWHVVVISIVEALIGVYLAWRLMRKSKQ